MGYHRATEILIFHALWACSAVLVLNPPDVLKTLAPDVGQRIFYDLLFYNLGLAIMCKVFDMFEEYDMWLFCIITSVMQVNLKFNSVQKIPKSILTTSIYVGIARLVFGIAVKIIGISRQNFSEDRRGICLHGSGLGSRPLHYDIFHSSVDWSI